MKRISLLLLGGLLLNAYVFAQGGDFVQIGKATQELEAGGLVAAHPSRPLSSKLTMVNMDTGKKVEITIIRRIPASPNRIVSVSSDVWRELALTEDTLVRLYMDSPSQSNQTAAAPQPAMIPPPVREPSPPPVIEEPAPVIAAVERSFPPLPPALPVSPPEPPPPVPEPPPPIPAFAPPPPEPPPPPPAPPPPAPEPPPPAPVPQPPPAPAPQPASPPPVRTPAPSESPVYVLVPVPMQPPNLSARPPSQNRRGIEIIPGLPDPKNRRIYRLQTGSFSILENAVSAAQLLKAAGFNVAYEKYGSLYRVLAIGVPAAEVYHSVRKMESIGIKQVWIRE